MLPIKPLLKAHHAPYRARQITIPTQHQQRRVRPACFRIYGWVAPYVDVFDWAWEEAALGFEPWDGDAEGFGRL